MTAGPGLVLFDNDGVLVDSEPLANEVLASLLTGLGVPTTYEESVRDYMGGSMARVRARVRERDGVALPDDFEDRYHDGVFAAFRAALRPVAGVAKVLDALGGAGIPACVASSGTHERIRVALETTGLLPYFSDRTIFSSQDVARGKPAPDLFVHAASVLGVPPSDCVVVEDSPLGVEGAKAAGMRVLGYAAMTPPEQLSSADGVFSDMAALPALLGV